MNQSQSQWFPEMERTLMLSGKSPRTREAYLRAIRQLVDHFDKDPRKITERELEDYFLFRRSESRWKPATLRLCQYGIKFYYRSVLHRSWKIFSIFHVEDLRHGKGATDRTVPLPQHTLSLLRRYWITHRHPSMIFPAVADIFRCFSPAYL